MAHNLWLKDLLKAWYVKLGGEGGEVEVCLVKTRFIHPALHLGVEPEDRQTDRQTDKTHGYMDRRANKANYEGQSDRWRDTIKQRNRWEKRQTDTQTDRQSKIHTYRHTD